MTHRPPRRADALLFGLLALCLTALPCLAQQAPPPRPPEAAACPACAPAPPPEAEAPMPPAFGGPLFERPKLTGDWCGLRDELAACGVTLDVSLTQFYQGVTRGGRQREWQYGGKGDYFLNVDGEKAGLWKGFFITAHGETRYGEDVNGIDALIGSGNINMLFPRPNQTVTALTSLKFTQALSENFITFFGKINTLDDYQPALGGGGRGVDRFMNVSLVFNPTQARTIPYSTLGAGFAVLSQKQPVFSFLVLDAVDRATTAGVDDLFERGAVMLAEGTLPTKFMGLPGHQTLGGTYSTRKYTAVDRASFLVVPGQGITAPRETGSWSLYYRGDQFLYVDPSDPKRGWGVFANLGLSDGNPNPIAWYASCGVQGNSAISGRENDTFGVGFFYLGLSNDFKGLLGGPLASRLGLSQQDERGLEVYYDVAVTPWCHLTADVQVAEPSTRAFDTTVLAGLRLKIDF